MKIEDLDEFEGLTADMVREWLRAKGLLLVSRTWAHPDKPKPYYWDSQLLTDGTLGLIAYDFGLSPQSLLSEINPRMRPGWPTDEEIEAHEKRGGLWICDYERGPCFGRFTEADRFEGNTLEMSRDALERLGAKFWPCDAHGNKVRRGTVPA